MDKLNTTTTALPVHIREVQAVNITSASTIVKKVDQCLSKLYPEQHKDPNPDPNPNPMPASTPAIATASTITTSTTSTTSSTSDFPAVSITSKSATASKAITVAEIVKRRIGEKGGQWYQYTTLSSVTNDLPGTQQQQPQKKKKKNGDANKAGEEEDPYDLLVEKIPPKKRKVPLLTIYISRSPIPELQKLHGEQSGP